MSSVFVLNGVNISLPAPRLTLEPVVGFDSLWMYNNRTYTRNEIRATCLPGNVYQWGFSFYVLLTFCIVTALYSIAMYSLWLRTYLHSRNHRAGQELGVFRAVMNFSEALKDQAGEDCTHLTEKQLLEIVNSNALGITCVNVDELPPPRLRRRGKQRNSV